MTEEKTENELSAWFSTYGLITAERILERYHLQLTQAEILTAVKNPQSIYHHLLRLPLRNVLNGIIMQQVHDYQVYAQKLLIDYLISGEESKGEGSPGAETRDDLEMERQKLNALSESFRELELKQERLIAESQAKLIRLVREWKAAQSNEKIKEIEHVATAYIEQAQTINLELRDHRNQFHQLILRVNHLVQLLPGYHPNKEQENNNRESLYFDNNIGEGVT